MQMDLETSMVNTNNRVQNFIDFLYKLEIRVNYFINLGVTSKLDYIKELGIDTIKLSPVASSMQGIHTKYGIIDFEKIHLTIGTMEDFENLIRTANAKGAFFFSKSNR